MAIQYAYVLRNKETGNEGRYSESAYNSTFKDHPLYEFVRKEEFAIPDINTNYTAIKSVVSGGCNC